LTPLPIDPLLPEVVGALRSNPALVLEAPPGAGKTTRVPGALLNAGLNGRGEIIVLQPRRLAARLAAARVAEERGERLGDTIGYQIRFEDVSGPKTKVRFLTEGLLTRRLISDPLLPGVGAVLLDEFHERHLAGDLGLAMLRRLQLGPRPDLKLVVMSATLDAEPIATWLGNCPRLRSEGRRFDVAIDYLPAEDDRHLEQQVLAALKRLVADNLDGDVLVFLPGAGEIRRARETCEEFCGRHQLELHALHGDLPGPDQDRAIRPGKSRKVILSTNVAETSVTIEGIAAVIDSGLARVAAHSPWSGLPTLKVQKVSRSSAIQRAGRAGRTRAGRCLRLYTKGDFDGRPLADAPEIRRMDLTEAVLALRASGVTRLGEFPFFEAPPAAALDAADGLLEKLGAVGPEGTLTELGRRLLRFPVHPRQARLIIEAERRSVAERGVTLAALLGERDIRLESRGRAHGERRGDANALTGPSDLLELLERFEVGQATGARAAGLEQGAFGAVERVRKQLSRLVRVEGQRPEHEVEERALLVSILSGYPDRVARRRRPKAPELILSGGGQATLDAASVVQEAELLVTVDAEERKGAVVVRLASQIEPEWLLELFPDAITDLDALDWNSSTHRVERITRLAYGNVVLEETRKPALASEEAAKVLAKAAVAAGIEKFVDADALARMRTRLTLARDAFPNANFPAFDDAFLLHGLTSACLGLTTFSELRESWTLDQLIAELSSEQAKILRDHFPDRVTLPGGRAVNVNYEAGKPPWIESRLQDFFGMAQGPSVGAGRIALVIHLLAPNMRAVQVTTDLAGFWERHYPAIRKELMRKYPRHHWPEDGRTAVPLPPRPRPPRK
jgi:ATP-dependent helicase HrpB